MIIEYNSLNLNCFRWNRKEASEPKSRRSRIWSILRQEKLSDLPALALNLGLKLRLSIRIFCIPSELSFKDLNNTRKTDNTQFIYSQKCCIILCLGNRHSKPSFWWSCMISWQVMLCSILWSAGNGHHKIDQLIRVLTLFSQTRIRSLVTSTQPLPDFWMTVFQNCLNANPNDGNPMFLTRKILVIW